jgi:hypothetical protein
MQLRRYTPAVSGRTLLLLQGLVWIAVGSLLLRLAAGWLGERHPAHLGALVAAGVVAALLIHHFGFLRVVDRNLARIRPLEDRRCVFSFMSWRSYLMVGVMMGMGFALRHSHLPRPHLAMLYIAIGLALVLSSVRYLRVLLQGVLTRA